MVDGFPVDKEKCQLRNLSTLPQQAAFSMKKECNLNYTSFYRAENCHFLHSQRIKEEMHARIIHLPKKSGILNCISERCK